MDSQPGWLDRTTGHVKLWISEFDFDKVHKAGIKNQPVDNLLLLVTKGTEGILPQDDISELVLSLVQRIDPHSDEQDGSMAYKGWVCEICNVIVGETQNSLGKAPAIVQAKAAHISTEEAETSEELIKEQAANGKCQAAEQTVGHPV